MTRVLLLGAGGQVGWELRRALAPLGEVVALDLDGAPGLVGNLADAAGVAATVQTVAPAIVPRPSEATLTPGSRRARSSATGCRPSSTSSPSRPASRIGNA